MQPDLIEQLNIESALAEELEQQPDLLPKQLVDESVSDAREKVAEYFRELALSGVETEPASEVVALKWRHGRRVVAVLPLLERVLYRAVIQDLSPDLVPRVRGKEEFDSFQRAPLQHEGTRFVVMTDIANYYSSIDLNRLSRELLQRSGKWAQVNWLRGFWETTSRGFGGIPQMNSASDVAGDTFVDILHKGLLRNGFAAWRYADDFRISCRTYGHCVEARELLDELARQVGLTVNERKTLTPSVEKYEDIIEGPQRRLDRINAEVAEALTGFDPYSWEDVTPEEAEVLQESAIRVLEIWVAEREDESGAAEPDAVDMTQVLPQSLSVLGVAGVGAVGLQSVPLLLRFEPQLTPVVARYLRLLALRDLAVEVGRVVQRCLDKLTLTKWQRLWLLNVMEVVPRHTILGEDTLVSWMRKETADPLLALRCQAMWATARSHELLQSDWESVVATGSRYAMPYAAAAAVGVSRGSGVSGFSTEGMLPAGLLERLVAEWSRVMYSEIRF